MKHILRLKGELSFESVSAKRWCWEIGGVGKGWMQLWQQRKWQRVCVVYLRLVWMCFIEVVVLGKVGCRCDVATVTRCPIV